MVVPLESPKVRDELADRIRRDLLGPWGGERETFGATEERSPRDRYVTGLLAPADADGSEQAKAERDSDDGDLASSESGDEGNEAVAVTAQQTRFYPTSMGLTFSVPSSVSVVEAEVTWGRYENVSAESLTEPDDVDGDEGDPAPAGVLSAQPPTGDDDGDGPVRRGRKGWRRIPMSATVPVDVIAADGRAWLPGLHVGVRWVSRLRGEHRLVSVFVVNEQTKESFPSAGGDASWMFQTQLSVTGTDRGSVFVSRPDMESDDPSGDSDRERQLLSMLYRRTPEFAVGHGVASCFEAHPDQGVGARAWLVRTESLPTHDVPQTVAPRPQDVPGLENLVLDMRVLAGGSAQDAVDGLQPLVDVYRSFLADQLARVDTEPDLLVFGEVAREQIRLGEVAADRIQAGLDLLTAGSGVSDAWLAFKFANESMALQRQHVEAIRASKTTEGLTWAGALEAADDPSKRSWRPFQIAFVLLNLPALTDPSHAERAAQGSAADLATADLLFFPTGGGKTEAYLGLTAYTFAIRRLQGVVEGHDGGRGVAVLMRYTLRLLTAQQFQRAAALVCATETLRRRSLTAEKPLGEVPFTLGLWVGGSVTPNSFDEAQSYVLAKSGRGKKADAFSTSPVPVRECPWCGSPIDAARDVIADKKTRRLVIYCGDTTGECPFTAKKNPGHGLPIVGVDEQIYREPPSLLIATVDKFAQLPWNGATAHLFGRVKYQCERHGYKHADIAAKVCGADTHRAEPGYPAAKTVMVGPLRPPDLVIQDELHLIAGALGTMVGLYETAIDRLSTWSVGGQQSRAKVIASTATIRRADQQLFSLFRRSMAVFPPPIIDIEDSFFARQIPVSEKNPGRRYVGLCAQGVRLKAVEIRVTGSVMGMAQMLFDEQHEQVPNPADPYMTLVAYFNALRELGGMRRLVDDDVRARLTHPNHEEMPRRYINTVEELTSRVTSDRIPDTLQRLDTAFGPDRSTQAGKARAEELKRQRGKKAAKAPKPATSDAAAWPVDVLLATNMFAVGVDVPRLGLMTMTGQPKSTAEYIQATSRVGRDPERPGLIVTIYNWSRPRDLSHYERFEHFHSSFYQQVEALSVTPFSLSAMERGLTGAFFGALRNGDLNLNGESGLDQVDVNFPQVAAVIDDFVHRAEAVTSDPNVGDDIRSLLEKRLADLVHQRGLSQGTETMVYRKAGDGKRKVLRVPDADSRWGMWTTPNSLRETEPDINLVLQADDPSLETGAPHEWRHPSAAPNPAGI